MVFAYYGKLTPAQQAVYRRSDAVASVTLPRRRDAQHAVATLKQALADGRCVPVARAARTLVCRLAESLQVPRVRITVLSVRPHDDWGELHGLYQPAAGRRLAHITVWMRTARRRQVVAPRTFLRTLLHEFCHHLDYALLQLGDSLHTEGFYQRESSLLRQLERR